MKTLLRVCGIFVVLGFFACQEEHHVAVSPPETTPAPTPKTTPIPTPVVRLAPEGVWYVKVKFHVQTEHGSKGFLAGKKVQFVGSEGNDFIVTDGTIEGRAPSDYFTNDLDEVDRIQEDKKRVTAEIATHLREQEKMAAEAKEAELKRQAEDKLEREKQRISDQIGLLNLERNALNERITKASNERTNKGFPPNGGSRSSPYYYYRHPHYDRPKKPIVTLSVDASQIEALIAEREKIDQDLNALKSSLSRLKNSR